MRESALNLTRQLAKTARIAIGVFEKNIIEDDGKMMNTSDGPKHPLASYVMNFVKLLLESQLSIRLLFFRHIAYGGYYGLISCPC